MKEVQWLDGFYMYHEPINYKSMGWKLGAIRLISVWGMVGVMFISSIFS